jgi:hypothetical protein
MGSKWKHVVRRLLLTQPRNPPNPPVNRGNQKGPLQGLHEERMMGLEPTTFCMASTRDLRRAIPVWVDKANFLPAVPRRCPAFPLVR